MSTLQEYVSPIESFVIGTTEYAGEITIEVKAEAITEVCLAMRDTFGFNYLCDISGIDYYTDEKRFGIAYNLVNLDAGSRIRVRCRVEEDKPEVDSVHEVWESAMWFEREAYDMLGIEFKNHPDLRRIFMPEDFQFFPLRKEFPLIGIPGSIDMPEKDPPKEYK